MCLRPNVPNLNPKDLGDVAEPLRSIIHTIQIDFAAIGRRIGLTSGGRSDGQQWDARRYNGVPHGQECNPAYKGHPTTAVPGRSRHRNTGRIEGGRIVAAADLNGDLAYLHTVAAEYGIDFPVPGEAWHAQPTNKGPRRRIIPYGAPADPNAPPAYPGFVLYGGITNDAVATWKVMLRFLNYQRFDTSPKGIRKFSVGTVAATKRFQKNNGLKVDGIVGPATWEKARQKIIAIRAKG